MNAKTIWKSLLQLISDICRSYCVVVWYTNKPKFADFDIYIIDKLCVRELQKLYYEELGNIFIVIWTHWTQRIWCWMIGKYSGISALFAIYMSVSVSSRCMGTRIYIEILITPAQANRICLAKQFDSNYG